ncbi:MAG: excinuclease ABC subunit C [Candidatus Cloacimonadota bacterium]|nr:MAG: excinuclease ABC subunit C [Candidatus Cloacimonadota bacterium]
MNNKTSYIYILTNYTNKVLYIGVTSDLIKRISQHRQKLVEGFTKKYNCQKLVYYEQFDDVLNAIVREKQLKKWSRVKKENLINSLNKDWIDLYEGLLA